MKERDITKIVKEQFRDFIGGAAVLPSCVEIQYPKIVPDIEAQGKGRHDFSFIFEGHTCYVSVNVPDSLYNGAKNTPRSVVIFSPRSLATKGFTPDQTAGLFRAMIFDKEQYHLLEEVYSQIQHQATKLSLDSNRTCEIITAFVQSLPYRSDQPAVKYPVETIVENGGDCDDKSLLLASLLFIGGYNVVLFLFKAVEPMTAGHMAVGIRTEEKGYANSGYAIIESVSPHLIGVSRVLQGDKSRTLMPPTRLPVKSSGIQYSGCEKIRYIVHCIHLIEVRIEQCIREEQELKRIIEQYKEQVGFFKDGTTGPDTKRSSIFLSSPEQEMVINRLNNEIKKCNTIINEINRGYKILDIVDSQQNNCTGLYNYFMEKLKFPPRNIR